MSMFTIPTILITLTYILLAVVFVVTILQIILFFKVWGMTNNVRDIKGRVHSISQNQKTMQSRVVQIEANYLEEAKIAYLSGDYLEAKKKLDYSFFKEIAKLSGECKNDPVLYQSQYERLTLKYLKIYRMLRLKSPDFARYEDPNSDKWFQYFIEP